MKESSATGMTDSEAEDNAKNLRALGQQFPELNSDSSYLVAVKKLSDAVQDISSARRIINENIKDYNTDIAQFPTSIISNLLGYTRKDLIDEKRALQEGNKLDRQGVDFDKFDI